MWGSGPLLGAAGTLDLGEDLHGHDIQTPLGFTT